MSLTYNGTEINQTTDSITYNGNDVKEVTLDGVSVWKKVTEVTKTSGKVTGEIDSYKSFYSSQILFFYDVQSVSKISVCLEYGYSQFNKTITSSDFDKRITFNFNGVILKFIPYLNSNILSFRDVSITNNESNYIQFKMDITATYTPTS